jgi:hypothetical protein
LSPGKIERLALEHCMSLVSTLESAASPGAERFPFGKTDHSQTRTDGAATVWIARGAIVAVALGLFWYTWGHWGDFQLDCGREVYVPAAILQGKLLYRDIWYMYGPLAPYVQAALFWTFGIHMNVLYGFGLALAVASTLTAFEIGRQLRLGVIASLVAPLFFLAEAFHPFIFNFIFPYSYAACLGSFLGSACLYFVLRHTSSGRARYLAWAVLLASLVIMTKQEIGFACVVLLAFEIAALYRIHRSKTTVIKNISIFAAGLVPAAAVYVWFVWKVSARVLFIENWIQTPGTYFMRTLGKKTMADQGFRFDPSELAWFAEFAALSLLLWWALARVHTALIERFKLRRRWSIALLTIGTFIPISMVLHESWAVKFAIVPLTHIFGGRTRFIQALADIRGFLGPIILPKGLFLLGIVFLSAAIYKAWKRRPLGLEESALAIYALFVGLREMAGVSQQTAVYFNVPLALIFIILLQRTVEWASGSLDAPRRELLVTGLLAAEGVSLFLVFFPNPSPQPSPLRTSIGTVYTEQDIAALAPEIISFMKTHSRNGNDILIVPEAPILYVMAGLQCPTRWYSLVPGYLPPTEEPKYIQEVSAANVQFVLLTNRKTPEYGIPPFGIGYNQAVYQWILANYVKTTQFGPLGSSEKAFAVSVLAKKEPQSGR